VISNCRSAVAGRHFLKKLLGFEDTQNYLIEFLNNTELRPGGGFIGVYGVVKVKNGVPEVLKVEGTEILDNVMGSDHCFIGLMVK
jgi:hypothetical protein